MLRLDGRLALARGLLRPSSELSGAGCRGADRLVGRKFERDAAEPGCSAAGAGTVSGDRAPSRPATARQDDEARRPLSGGLASKKRRLRAQTSEGLYELCSATKPLRIESFHDQFGYTPEPKNLGPVLLRVPVKLPRARVTPRTGQPAGHIERFNRVAHSSQPGAADLFCAPTAGDAVLPLS